MTYRDPADSPVCARCKHRADGNAYVQTDEKWRDWLCVVSTIVTREAEYNPITGVETPAKIGFQWCRIVNRNGDCTKFELSPATPASDALVAIRLAPVVPPEIVPAETMPKPRRWWWPWKGSAR